MQPQLSDAEYFSEFLSAAGWGEAILTPLGADMGLRRYYMLQENDRQELLMDMSRAGILENGLDQYIKVAEYLRGFGLNAPEIYYADLKSGLAVIEYFGEKSFGDCVQDGKDKKELYRMATEILLTLRDCATKNTLDLPDIHHCIPMMKLQYFAKAYMPFVGDRPYDPAWEDEFLAIFNALFKQAKPCAKIFAHADYHLENLIWKGEKTTPYGLIDFQDAFWVEQPYDLVNLLEDARQTVPQDIKDEMRALYCAEMTPSEREGFDDWYAILSAFFHCKVIGQIIYYYQTRGLEQYLCHVPRLQGYIAENLKNPVLAPLQAFVDKHNISFTKKITA